jgi:hypothetical protein
MNTNITNDVLTAEQARSIANSNIQERVNEVYPLIKAAAIDHKFYVHLMDEFWRMGGYNETTEWQLAVKMLEENGYQVSYFNANRPSNGYTTIRW